MDFFILAILGAIVFLGLAALQWGVDTRPTLLDQSAPSSDVTS